VTWVGELTFASSPGHTHVVMMIGVKECRANRFGLLQTTNVLVECSRQVAFKPLFRKSPVAASDETCVCPGLDANVAVFTNLELTVSACIVLHCGHISPVVL